MVWLETFVAMVAIINTWSTRLRTEYFLSHCCSTLGDQQRLLALIWEVKYWTHQPLILKYFGILFDSHSWRVRQEIQWRERGWHATKGPGWNWTQVRTLALIHEAHALPGVPTRRISSEFSDTTVTVYTNQEKFYSVFVSAVTHTREIWRHRCLLFPSVLNHCTASPKLIYND